MHIQTGRAKLVVIFILIITFILVGLSFLLPVAPMVQNPVAAHMRTAVAAAASIITIAAALWFLRGLSSFKAESRRAYILISIGLIIFSGALLQVPIIGLFDLWKSPWTTSGAALIPFVIPMMTAYMGFRTFARLLQIKSRLLSIRFVTLIALALTIFTLMVAPLLIRVDNPKTVAVSLAVIIWSLTFTGISSWLAHLVRHAIGPYYKVAMLRLEVAFIGLTVSGLHEYIASFFLTNGSAYADYGLYIWPWVASSFLLLLASYQFRLLTLTSSAAQPVGQSVADRDYVESIVAVAALTSTPEEIDPILDDLRAITSNSSPERHYSPAEKQRLLGVYSRLEAYFVHNEDPLRTFTKEQLRQYVTPAFRAMLSAAS